MGAQLVAQSVMLTFKKVGNVQCAFHLEHTAVSKETVVAGSEKHLAHTFTVQLPICASEITPVRFAFTRDV